MPTRSLRGKIFLLVIAILIVLAALVMLVTQRDVTGTVEAGEQHAVDNAMALIQRDVDARWLALFDDKINSVREDRNQLIAIGNMVESVLKSYADMAASGAITSGAARGLARQWINRIRLENPRYVFVYDNGYSMLASSAPGMTDLDLSGVQDIKGRRMAQALYEETSHTGSDFAIYPWPVAGQPGSTEMRYAYFAFFVPWHWVIAISDNAQTILEHVQAHRQQMETALRASLSRLTLAQSGFMFVMENGGRMVVDPPEGRRGLVDETDTVSGKQLRELLAQAPQSGDPLRLTFHGAQGVWQIQAVYNKPLGWTLAAAVPATDLTIAAQRLVNRQAVIFAVMLILAVLFAWLVATRMTRPLDQLTAYARQLPDEDLTARAEAPAQIAALPRQHADEVGRLAESFLFMQRKLGENVTRLMKETTARERIESELGIAHEIQMGLLPVPLPAEALTRVDLHATMIPAKEVGGDIYDYFMLADGRLCFAIGDVSDKGVPAALFMAVTRTLIRSTAEDEADPALIMQRVNNRLAENNPNMMFVTLLLGVLDLDSGELAWANAGHPPPAVVQADGAVRLLEGRSGPACGVQEGLAYRPLSAMLAPGEALVGYTDGVTEAFDSKGKEYGEARMLALLAGLAGNAADLGGQLLADVHGFTAGAEQSDDITLIVVRRT